MKSAIASRSAAAVLFFPVVPRRFLSVRTESVRGDGLGAWVESSGRFPRGLVATRCALALAGVAALLLTLALIYLTSSNTGLAGGLLVVVCGGLLTAVAGGRDCLCPRIEEGPDTDDQA